jgi:hypothetical protein
LQGTTKKYHMSSPRKRIGILFFLLSLGLFVTAQDDQWADTVEELKYQLDTVVPVPALTDSTDEDAYTDESDDETKADEEFFLRKEFTGGLPDSFQLRKLPVETIKALREDKAFWYANEAFKKKEKQKQGKNFTAHPFFQTVLWLIIIGGFVTFLILYLYNSNARLFRRSSQITEEETDPESSDIFTINYQKEIDKAVSMENYRLAVRLLFLRLLRNLSDRNIIQYKQDSTNFDYLVQLHATKLYHDFFRLTRSYEYSWYGQFDIDKEKYFIIKKDFDHFDSKLGR